MNRERERERDLVDSSADELATENNVTKQDGEIAAWLWVLRLLIQHEPCYCHQVRPVCLRRVIHFPPLPFLFSLLSLSLQTPWCSVRGQTQSVYIYIYIFFFKCGQRKWYARRESEWMGADEMRWDEMIWWDGAISYSYLLSTEVSEDTWRTWSEGSERVVVTAVCG